MTTLNVSLPGTMREWILSRVAEGGFSSASEYLRSLVREDQKRAAEQHLEVLLAEGLEGEAKVMTKNDWEEVRSEVRKRVVAKRRQGKQ